MTTQQAELFTLTFMVAVAAIVIAYDVAIYHAYGAPATISRVTRSLFGRYPSVFAGCVFAAGVFVGHTWLAD